MKNFLFLKTLMIFCSCTPNSVNKTGQFYLDFPVNIENIIFDKTSELGNNYYMILGYHDDVYLLNIIPFNNDDNLGELFAKYSDRYTIINNKRINVIFKSEINFLIIENGVDKNNREYKTKIRSVFDKPDLAFRIDGTLVEWVTIR